MAARVRSRARRIAFRAAAALVGIAAALLLVEATLRVLDLRSPGMLTKRRLNSRSDPGLTYHCYPDNPDGAFSAAPSVESGAWRLLAETVPARELPLEDLARTPWCVEYRISEQSLRDRFYGPRAPTGVLRIAGIGDSFAFGEGVPLEDSLFKRLESLLGDGYEVINAAVPGAGTAREREILDQVSGGLDASRAIVIFTPNDIALTRELRERQDYINDLVVIREPVAATRSTSPLRSIELMVSALRTRRITRETLRWYRDMYDAAHNRPGLERLAEDLRAMAGRPGRRVALVIYPLMEGLDRYPLGPVHATVTALAREAGLPVLDLAPAFAGRDAASLHVHPSDHHPNAAAHDLAARAIAEWLRREHPDFLAGP
jgi:lysophospholipase L1-like esterase